MTPEQRDAVDKSQKARGQIRITDSEAFNDAIAELQDSLDEVERETDHIRANLNTILQLAGLLA